MVLGLSSLLPNDKAKGQGAKTERLSLKTGRRPRFAASRLLIFAVALSLATPSIEVTVLAQARGGVHPAVVRVVATDRDGFSLGSGTLVAVNEHHGLVVTNWHVVRDAAGPIAVMFPNGFRSAALVLKTDREWDLAALAIWRPNVEPVPLSNTAPRPGEPLTIAGYGSGQYRTITGRCTKYVAPGYNQPFEMVELSAPARQGDSGGPIFNSRGELAGVLFGTAGGQTSGSYCGRVRMFLESVRDDFYRLAPPPAALAQQHHATPKNGPPATISQAQSPPPSAVPTVATSSAATVPSPSVAIAANASPPAPVTTENRPPLAPSPLPAAEPPPTPLTDLGDLPSLEANSLWNDVRNYLAVVGVAAILFHSVRFLTETQRASRRRRYS